MNAEVLQVTEGPNDRLFTIEVDEQPTLRYYQDDDYAAARALSRLQRSPETAARWVAEAAKKLAVANKE